MTTEAIKITAEALLKALGPLPDGYGPDVYWGPIKDKPHSWFSPSNEGWFDSNTPTTVPHFHAYKREPVKRVVWMNVYRLGGCTYVYPSKADADSKAFPGRMACIRVEFEEGQFDE